MSVIIRRRHQRTDIGGERFLFLATLRQYDLDGTVRHVDHNEILRVIETKRGATLVRVGTMEGELKAAALKFAGVQ